MLIEDATSVVYEAVVRQIENGNNADWSKIKGVIKDSLGDYIWKK